MNQPIAIRLRHPGHTLIELVAAMVASAVLLAGLGSVMLIARQVAYTPSAAARRTQAADVVNRLSDELRYATMIVEHVDEESEQALEFVVADRDNDGASERIRYDWPLHPDPDERGPDDPPQFYKSVNGQTWVIAEDISENEIEDIEDVPYRFMLEPPYLPGQSFSQALVKLQTGAASHSRVDAAILLLARPEQLSAWWRTDFDINPTSIDIDSDGNDDWVATNGAAFGSPQMSNGVWHANGDLATNPPNPFTGVTIVEARCKNMAASGVTADVLRINADRRGAAYAALIVRMQRQLDGSQTLSLLGMPTSGTPVALPAITGSILPTSTVENLTDDYVRFRLIILPAQNPAQNKVNLQINDEVLGTFTYQINGPSSSDQCVKILGSGGAKFDYVDVRVRTN